MGLSYGLAHLAFGHDVLNRRHWGEYPMAALVWLAVLTSVFLPIAILLVLLSFFRSPLMLEMGTLPYTVPLSLTLFGYGGLVFFLGLLLVKIQPEKAPENRRRLHRQTKPLSRVDWEQHVANLGYVLERPVYTNDARLQLSEIRVMQLEPDPADTGAVASEQLEVSGTGVGLDEPIDNEVSAPEVGVSLAFQRSQTLTKPSETFSFQYLMSDKRLYYWPHQYRLLESMLHSDPKSFLPEGARQSRDTGVCFLMHLPRMTGKTTAVFEGALRTVRERGRYALMLYPDRLAAMRAKEQFATMVREAHQEELVRFETAGDTPKATFPDVLFASVDWLADSLMGQMVEYQAFIEKLGLLVFEDVDRLSGIRATNLAIVNRRLIRLVATINTGSMPIMVQTLSVNPAEASGAQEYASWLAGSYFLHEQVIRNDAPKKELFLYRLQAAPAQLDAQRADPLPNVLRLAWTSFVYVQSCVGLYKDKDLSKSAVHFESLDSVTASDLSKPNWVDHQLDSPDLYEGHKRPAGWQLDTPSAESWVSIAEVAFVGSYRCPKPSHIEASVFLMHLGVSLLSISCVWRRRCVISTYSLMNLWMQSVAPRTRTHP